MKAKLLDGKKVADHIATELKQRISKLTKVPELRVIMVGDNFESKIYVQNKVRRAEELGINIVVEQLPSSIEENSIIDLINDFNHNWKVDGVMVQLPLPPGISYYRVINSINPEKDVDGFSEKNIGRLWIGQKPLIPPATPDGIMTLLDFYNLKVSGQNSVIIGRSNIVGKPLAGLLLARDSTVTITHRKTRNLKEITQQADFLFVAAGQKEFVDASYIKPKAVVVDVGMNRSDQGVTGDVDFKSVESKASFITPVPKGIGPMTVISLMQHVVNAAKVKEDGTKSK